MSEPFPQINAWYDRFDQNEINTVKRAYLVPALVFQSIAVRRAGERSLEGVGAVRVDVAPPPDAAYGDAAQGAWDAVLRVLAGATPADQRGTWESRVLPVLVNLLREGRHVFFPEFHELRKELRRY